MCLELLPGASEDNLPIKPKRPTTYWRLLPKKVEYRDRDGVIVFGVLVSIALMVFALLWG